MIGVVLDINERKNAEACAIAAGVGQPAACLRRDA
jgi:hypothetical protein